MKIIITLIIATSFFITWAMCKVASDSDKGNDE